MVGDGADPMLNKLPPPLPPDAVAPNVGIGELPAGCPKVNPVDDVGVLGVCGWADEGEGTPKENAPVPIGVPGRSAGRTGEEV